MKQIHIVYARSDAGAEIVLGTGKSEMLAKKAAFGDQRRLPNRHHIIVFDTIEEAIQRFPKDERVIKFDLKLIKRI